ncbi:MAG: branched-chain amino acid ABC transporter permease [archaeon]
MIEAYFIHLLILIGIYLILALSLQLSIGYTGLLNLGHIAFYAIGAYTSALLVMHGFPFWFAFIMAGILAAVSGMLLSLPTSKLKGDYLALATLAFTFVVYAVTLNWTGLTRGPLGLPGIPKPSFFGFVIADNLHFLIFTLIIVGVTYLVMRRTVDSQFGKVLGAIRDDELAARVMGKNAFLMKTYSLGIAAFFAGIAGSLYAHYITFIDPSSFTLMQLIPLLSIVIIAGLGTLNGTVLATIILVLLPEPLRFIGFPSSIVGPARQILYALILLVILVFKPTGFYGKVNLD